MSDTNRLSSNSIEDSLIDNPMKWGFFQAVRNLDCLSYSKSKNNERTGDSDSLRNEVIRFKQRPFFGFKDSEIDKYIPATSDKPAEMYVNFFGLWGINSPLPLVLTEYAFNRNKHYNDDSLINFIDIFHNRMIALFYKAWAMNQQSVEADRDNDSLKKYLASLIGVGALFPDNNSSHVSLNSKLYFAGHVLYYTPNISSLSAILSDYFQTKTEIKPFVTKHVEIPHADRFYLIRHNTSSMLGRNIIIGKKFITGMMKFRIIMGPMNLEKYMQLFPEKDGYLKLVSWVRYYISNGYDFDVQLILNPWEIPDLSLGKAAILGRTCWLRSNPEVKVNNEVIVNAAS